MGPGGRRFEPCLPYIGQIQRIIAEFALNFDKNFDKLQQSKTYELATLHAPKGGTWLIIWYNINPATGELERLRKTFKLNRIRDLAERRTVANNLISLINLALPNGWNFFTNNEPPALTPTLPPAPFVPLLKAFNDGLRLKMERKAASSLLSYTSIGNIFRNYLNDAGLLILDVKDFSAGHFQAYISAKVAAGNSSRNLNAHIDLVKHVFKKTIYPLQYLTVNPLADYEYYDEEDSERFEPLTPDELRAAADAIGRYDVRLLLFTYFIYYGYIRPSHIPGLQRRQIDFAQNILYVRPDNTKNKKMNSKQLLKPLKDLLLRLEVNNLPEDYYIFSTNFLPGDKLVTSLRTRAQELWKKLVIDGLGIHKKLYALKHTSGTAYISDAETVDAVWLQRQMEHSSLSETEAYIKKRRMRRLDEGTLNLPDY